MVPRTIVIAAILACIQAGSLGAQDATNLGQPLMRGQSQAPRLTPEPYPAALDPDGAGSGHRPTAQRLGKSLAQLDKPQPAPRLRGAREVELFRKLAGSVVLVLLEDSLGSGSLIAVRPAAGNAGRIGTILTNWHVVEDESEAAIIFKPDMSGSSAAKPAVLRGRVRKVDPRRDLALVEVAGIPAWAQPIELGTMDEAQVGADVHAIGHPLGEIWTYTKGLISQVRDGYEWQPQGDMKHKADVIQTQTPINPGNSGGPLFGDSGHLLGVNSFKSEGEALNFAVAVREVQSFLAAAQRGQFDYKPGKSAGKGCQPKSLFTQRTPENDGSMRGIDMTCSGKADAVLIVPDNKTSPVEFQLDTNKDGRVDAVIYDRNRDGRWDDSLWDTDFDGKPDLVGFHPDGELKPSRFEKYQPRR